MSNVKTLQDAINKARDILAEAGTESQRKALNIKPHFIPLNLAVLDNMLTDKLVEGYSVNDLRSDIIKYLKKSTSAELVSSGSSLYFITDPTTPLSLEDIKSKVGPSGALVYEGRAIKGVLYTNFSNTQKFLFKEFLNTTLADKIKTKAKYEQVFDPGHTVFPQDRNLGTAPLAKKTEDALEAVYKRFYSVYDTLTKTQKTVALRIFKQLNNAEKSFDVHHQYSNKVYATLNKDFKDSLLSVSANVVLIQDTLENRGRFAAREQQFVNAVFKVLEDQLPNVNFSNNLKEEIEQRLYDAFSGKQSKSSKSTKKLDLGTKTVKSKTKATTQKANLPEPRFKNLETKRSIGLTRLLSLLNNHLQDVVSANMQDPDDYERGSRKLLTYRTGRFAESAKVERLTASRNGAITAFYSYMKYPYATFSAGGRQQNPRSRDPKSLISKSIREIAAKYVAEQMRAVNV